MSDVVVIKTLEELTKYLNKNGLPEIATRGKKQKFKQFVKVAIDNLENKESVTKQMEKVVNVINKNNKFFEKNLNILNNVANLGKLNLVLQGANLFATAVGFAIMYAKLDKISSQIADVVNVFKKGQGIQVNYEFKKIISEHSNMLDCRKKMDYYTEEQMRELVDGEYNVLGLLIDVFLSDISTNREELLLSIMSLASMLSVSIKYFDEIYYFQNKDVIGDGDKWHISHDKWLAIFDRLSSPLFMETIQDYGLFEMRFNTVENDYFYISIYDQIKNLKQNIEENQTMIETINDKELFINVTNKLDEEIKIELENAFEEAGVDSGLFEQAMRVAIA